MQAFLHESARTNHTVIAEQHKCFTGSYGGNVALAGGKLTVAPAPSTFTAEITLLHNFSAILHQVANNCKQVSFLGLWEVIDKKAFYFSSGKIFCVP